MERPVRPFSGGVVQDLLEFLEREIALETRQRAEALRADRFDLAYHRKMELAALNRVRDECVRLLQRPPCAPIRPARPDEPEEPGRYVH